MRLATLVTLLVLSACRNPSADAWQLTDVTGHLPNLRFSLLANNGKPLDERAFQGKITLMFFGYTHCPDVCPTTLAKLTQVLQMLDTEADQVRIAFVSVDPARDTPDTMNAYVQAFDATHAVGLSGSLSETEKLAKRYRVAFAAEKRDAAGRYEVTHSGAVYLFDQTGRARLIASVDAESEKFVHDLRLLLSSSLRSA